MKEETVEHILEVGTELIIQHGYHGLGLQKILDTAGIPKGSFYYYFKSKEDFGLKVIDFFSQQNVTFLKTFLEKEEVEPKQRILDLFQFLKGVYTEQEFSQGCLLGNCSLELGAYKNSFAELLSDKFEELQAVFALAIQEGHEKGNININMSANDYAAFIINTWEGTLVRMKVVKSNEPLDLLIDVLNRLL